MSIDYDRLRELVDTSESTDVPLINQVRATAGLQDLAADLARELLRLRDGVGELADDFGANAEYAPNIPAQKAFIEAECHLAHLLEGDAE